MRLPLGDDPGDAERADQRDPLGYALHRLTAGKRFLVPGDDLLCFLLFFFLLQLIVFSPHSCLIVKRKA